MLRKAIASLMVASVLFVASASSAAVTNVYKRTSVLNGSPTVNAKAVYHQCKIDGVTCKKFIAHVTNAPANKLYPVYVKGKKVGTVKTNNQGNGKLTLMTPAFIGTTNAKPIPSNFPVLQSGNGVEIGTMQGVFWNMQDDFDEYEIEGEMSDDDEIWGSAVYIEELEDNGFARRFEVEFGGGNPGQLLDISVNGIVVGTVEANEDGEVYFMLLSENAEDYDDDSVVVMSMPDTFPTVLRGDVIRVGPAVAVMGIDD